MNTLTIELQSIVRNLGRDDLTTVESLLIDLCGDTDAGRMLNRLVMWWSKTSNPEGWVYKDHADWWAELRIKQHRLPRTKGALERVGVVIRVKKANGNPTRHYKLDIKAFWQALASALKVSRKKLVLLMQKPSSANSKKEVEDGQKTITTSPSIQLQDVVVNTAIQEAKKVQGISDHTARLLVAQYGTDHVLKIALRFQQGTWKNAAGAFVRALQENWQFDPIQPPHSAPPPQGDRAKWDADAEYTTEGDSDITPAEMEFEDGTATDVDETTPAPDEIVNQSPEAAAWRKAYSQLEIQLDRASFDTWVRAAHFLRVENEQYVIGLPNEYARGFCQHRLYRDIRRVLRDVSGVQCEIQFEVHKVPARQDNDLPLFAKLAALAAQS